MSLNLKINIFGKLELAKKDNKGNYVPNTKFKISYNSDMSNPVGTYTTSSNGKVIADQLKLGTIYIQEVEVPKHLILDTTIRSAEIKMCIRDSIIGAYRILVKFDIFPYEFTYFGKAGGR